MAGEFDAKALGAKLMAARRSGKGLEAAAAGALPRSFADAFAVQEIVARETGAVGAFKTANVGDGGDVPIAPIAADNVRLSPARYGGEEMRRVGIELEIAFRIERDLPDPSDPDFDVRLRKAVSVVPVIEMVDTRLADVEGAPALLKLADNQSGFGLVIGEPVADWQGLDLATPAITFTVDGCQIGTTAGAVPGGSAVAALAGCVRAIGNHCGGLQVGQYVTTGSLSGLHWIEKGVEVAGTIAGLGSVAVRIDA